MKTKVSRTPSPNMQHTKTFGLENSWGPASKGFSFFSAFDIFIRQQFVFQLELGYTLNNVTCQKSH